MRHFPKLYPEKIVSGKLVLEGITATNTYLSPDDALKEDYFYCFGGGGYLKFGKSQDWQRRLATIQSCCPFELNKVATRKVRRIGADYAEAYALYHLGPVVRGEWVSAEGITKSQINKVMGQAVRRAAIVAEHKLTFHANLAQEWQDGK